MSFEDPQSAPVPPETPRKSRAWIWVLVISLSLAAHHR